MNEKVVREAIALWKQEAVRRTAERLREDGLAILEGRERDRLDACAAGPDDHPGFELDALLRAALELDPDGPRARAEAALSGQPQARREILEPLAGFAQSVLAPSDETGRAEVRQALPLFVEGLIEIIEAQRPLWRGEIGAHVAAAVPAPAGAPEARPSAVLPAAAVPDAGASTAPGPVTSDVTSDAGASTPPAAVTSSHPRPASIRSPRAFEAREHPKPVHSAGSRTACATARIRRCVAFALVRSDSISHPSTTCRDE
ncbi:hypothetical protein [Salinarimonas rosea]|uniref:hypothetical protein n=1 Tax=Salinarimonas rosea TaxID=552063 RepID=UPI00040A2357|nr:hypothetical protein [Salinarimonas rosea]